jgi:hypothetical protein
LANLSLYHSRGRIVNEILAYLNAILSYLISWSGLWVWLVTAFLIAALLYVRPHAFWLTDLIYRFPLIGKLARFSDDYSESVPGGWLNVELTLCRDYARHVNSLSEDEFQNHVEYLRKANDHGRRPMPAWAVLLISILVVFEGLAFAYILGSWISVESSENQRFLFMLAIVAVLAIILVIVTHAAGHQIYRTRLLQACFREGRQRTIRDKEFTSRIISLADEQSLDDDQPANIQCTNRVISQPGDRGSYAWVWIAGLFVLVIAVGSTLLRIETLDVSNDADLLSNLFGEAAPTGGANSAGNTAAFVSFAILGVIFLVTQLVAISFGHKYGFAGKQSDQAYGATGGYADYRSYWRPIQHRMNIANLRLQTLQRLLERNASHPIDWHKNFFDFIREEREAGNRNLNEPPRAPDRPRPPTEPASAQAEQPNAAGNVTPIDRTAS